MAPRKPAPATGKKRSSGLWFILLLALPLAWCGGRESADDRVATSTPAPLVSTPAAPIVSKPAAHAPAAAPLTPSALEHVTVPSTAPDVSSGPPPETLYATTKLNVRGRPNSSAPVIGNLAQGDSVETGEERNGWRRVSVPGGEGWVSSRYLADRPPPVAAPPPPSRTIARVAADPDDEDDSGGDTPIREPYVGTCDCPYDQMRNGRSCGGRSAYSKPGGRKPKCYR